ncbi:HD domain-containing protein [bacterium]|nr:HD domain-containing protein [bacterium]
MVCSGANNPHRPARFIRPNRTFFSVLSMFQLTCQNGPAKGRTLTINGPTTVGREATCGIMLDDPKVSRVHGTFVVRDGRLYFNDNKSTNGTFLNGERVSEAEIQHGDVLKLGSNEFALLQEDDFRTINFMSNVESAVTSKVSTQKVRIEDLAGKFSSIFRYYAENQPNISEEEKKTLARTERLLNGLQTIFAISQTMTKIVSIPELLPHISKSLFDVFEGAENLVVLLQDSEKKSMVVRHAASRDSDEEPSVTISRTVLDRAIQEKCTLIANDAAQDSRLSSSESIIGFSVKSVMCAPLITGDNVLGALYFQNRMANVHYDDLDAELVTAFANQCAIAIENANLCDTLQAHYIQTLQALVNAIEAKDSYTMGHTARVSRYSVGIGKRMGLDDYRLGRLKMAADLHDIGKIGIKEGIINKPGALTDTEYHTIKDHVEMGEKILRPITFLHDLLPYIRGHHEKWDGTGYPDGLKGEECPLEGRIIALADALDAMTSQRSYNKPMTFTQAGDRIRSTSGKHFDPAIVEAFEKFLQQELLPEEAERNRKAKAAEDNMEISTSKDKVPFFEPKTTS